MCSISFCLPIIWVFQHITVNDIDFFTPLCVIVFAVWIIWEFDTRFLFSCSCCEKFKVGVEAEKIPGKSYTYSTSQIEISKRIESLFKCTRAEVVKEEYRGGEILVKSIKNCSKKKCIILYIYYSPNYKFIVVIWFTLVIIKEVFWWFCRERGLIIDGIEFVHLETG